MDGETGLPFSKTSEDAEAPPEKPPIKQKKPREIKESSEAIDKNNGKDTLFFTMLLETKKQLDRESRTARISNLSIV